MASLRDQQRMCYFTMCSVKIFTLIKNSNIFVSHQTKIGSKDLFVEDLRCSTPPNYNTFYVRYAPIQIIVISMSTFYMVYCEIIFNELANTDEKLNRRLWHLQHLFHSCYNNKHLQIILNIWFDFEISNISRASYR